MKNRYTGKATLILLILASIFSCQTEQEIKEKDLNVVFTGDISTLRKINFSFFDGTTSFTKGSTTLDSSGILILSLPNDITRLGVLQMPGVNKSIFVTSNDTIALDFINEEKAKDLAFTGQNSFHYNSLDKLIKLQFDTIKYSGDIKKYKELIQRNYEDQKKLLKEYYKEKRCSSNFREVINIELESEYFSSLIKPLYSQEITLEDLPDTYFENVTIDFFNNDLMLKSRKGTLAMKLYLDHYFTKPYPNFSEEKFSDQEMFIIENFIGNTGICFNGSS
ncbi:hypothetical protein LZ575_01155 [Antarcticibacterium sp. 1MA-6-2]|uniref:hypothetical protein n=1 Tax=Antarcticibacterium sp. 1MA-6-2 TaxID=2908210 RepID=UPI001F418AC9|nr:hypothetical protein [Antarcticibacterium sp. 1MA-6-2]UJH91423.1 hypothetical protein LZ575_01155 [Antarcticibacterium sp. 1MA-6-2]